MRAILIDPGALSKCLFEPFFQGRILKGQKTVARWLSPICTELVDNCFGHSSGKKRRIFFTYRSAILSFANSDPGRVLLRLSAQANIERAKEGTRRLKWSVGFLTGAPHLQWSKIYKATSGIIRMGLKELEDGGGPSRCLFCVLWRSWVLTQEESAQCQVSDTGHNGLEHKGTSLSELTQLFTEWSVLAYLYCFASMVATRL